MWTKIHKPNSKKWEQGWYFFRLSSSSKFGDSQWTPFYWNNGVYHAGDTNTMYYLDDCMRYGRGEVFKVKIADTE